MLPGSGAAIGAIAPFGMLKALVASGIACGTGSAGGATH